MAKESVSQIEKIRHSLAHILAMAVLEKYPKTKLGIGPTIEHGFYYDFKLPGPLNEGDFPELEKTMRRLINQRLDFTGKKITPAQAKKMFKDEPFKLDLVTQYAKEKKQLTAYFTCPPKTKLPQLSKVNGQMLGVSCFFDLCKGGHVRNTKEINPDAFKITKAAGAYWRGDEKKPMLTRIYAVAFETKKELDEHLKMLEEAKRRDHKKLGAELDLFTFSEKVGSGLPLWTPKGTLLRDLLDDFVWELRKKAGYAKVEIPHITKKELYETSGHWEKFKDELFRITTREGHEFAMKPMNCPHHTQIYARRLWSYRELPQRYANTTMCYRDEQTGELSGLSRARSFTQDDAHVFCRMPQAKEEFLKIWDIVHEFYSAFGFQLNTRLSLHDPKHPEKYLGDKKRWKVAEDVLQQIAKERGGASEAPGEAAFYGPKIDFMAKDSLGREWQVATIQLDMNMPERFDLTCTNEEGKPERVVMIHAAIMGSIERFLSIAIEHFAGAFPLWLSPVQAAVIPVSERLSSYAREVNRALSEHNVRVEISEANETLSKRIREAELQKTPYVLVVGEKEAAAHSVSVRQRGRGDLGAMPLAEFIKKIENEIRKRS